MWAPVGSWITPNPTTSRTTLALQLQRSTTLDQEARRLGMYGAEVECDHDHILRTYILNSNAGAKNLQINHPNQVKPSQLLSTALASRLSRARKQQSPILSTGTGLRRRPYLLIHPYTSNPASSSGHSHHHVAAALGCSPEHG